MTERRVTLLLPLLVTEGNARGAGGGWEGVKAYAAKTV